MKMGDGRLAELTERVIGCAYTVSNTLGHGCLEKVYENSLAHELRKAGMQVEQQKEFQVLYEGHLVGEYVADMIVDGCLLVELKTAKVLDNAHLAQGPNYLKVTGLQVCLLTNFGRPHVQVRRIINGF